MNQINQQDLKNAYQSLQPVAADLHGELAVWSKALAQNIANRPRSVWQRFATFLPVTAAATACALALGIGLHLGSEAQAPRIPPATADAALFAASFDSATLFSASFDSNADSKDLSDSLFQVTFDS